MRALISVYDKSELAEFARGLLDLGFELVASGGTSAYLEEHAVAVTAVEEVTAFPELLGGRVKTLHPRIHAGILARADRNDDVAALDEHGIAPFALVCVNLYPFERAPDVEQIDVGGPALLRAAAKNFAHVAPVSSPSQYGDVLAELAGTGDLSPETRRGLAAAAFSLTAAYDAQVAEWLEPADSLPRRFVVAFDKFSDLVYGENPHQRAALYGEQDFEKLHGRDLSLTNLLDLAHARAIVSEFEEPACAIVKHANPSGVAVAGSIDEAFTRALACDPVSAFGMACVLNRRVGQELAGMLAERVIDVLCAPGYDEAALAILRRKPATRILKAQVVAPSGELDYKRVPGGVLVQERDAVVETREDMTVVCGVPTAEQWADLLFAWRVCAHVGSNAIVVARAGQTIGIGPGQVSRVDAVRLALDKAHAHAHSLEGAVLASDAFFPFADGPQLALAAGIRAFIQPGGSKRDAEVAAAVAAPGAAMVFTHRRHFRH